MNISGSRTSMYKIDMRENDVICKVKIKFHKERMFKDKISHKMEGWKRNPKATRC